MMQTSITDQFSLAGYIPRTTVMSGAKAITSIPSQEDSYWMAQALIVGMDSIGLAEPNPSVGCVIVRNGAVIAKAATEIYGGKHAERVAIEQVKDTAKLVGATLYCTLEPCSHTGRQPPCATLVSAVGLARCVIGIQDPNPLVSGKGIAALQAAGLSVDVGVMQDAVMAWHYPFLLRYLLGRTVVALKWAQTMDGQLSLGSKAQKKISGSKSHSYAHWLRQRYDAILIGAETALDDCPSLTARECAKPHARHPVRLIYDPNERLFSADIQTVQKLRTGLFSSDSPSVILSNSLNTRNPNSPMERMIQELRIPVLHLDPGIDPVDAIMNIVVSEKLSRMVERNLNSIIVEGGPRLLALFLNKNRVDAVHVFIAPVLGGAAGGHIPLPSKSILSDRFQTYGVFNLNGDVLLEMFSKSAAAALHGFCPDGGDTYTMKKGDM